MSESFSQTPYSGIIPAYAYSEYADDENVQAFFGSMNAILQGYLTWFSDNPLAVYVGPQITGPLLDWTAQGIYGISRPVLGTSSTTKTGELGTKILGEGVLGTLQVTQTGTSISVSDDIYKRVMTWILFRGDGMNFNMPWLLRRIERFLGGINGADVPLDLSNRAAVNISENNFEITVPPSNPASTFFQQLMSQGYLPTPAAYNFSVSVSTGLANDGGVVQLIAYDTQYPTSSAGLASGALWNNGGVISIAGSPTPSSPPVVMFSSETAYTLYALGGANFPLTNPNNTGQLWNNSGVLSVS